MLRLDERHDAVERDAFACWEIGEDGQMTYLPEVPKYDAGNGALNVPSFANVADDIVYNYIETQSDMLFDYE